MPLYDVAMKSAIPLLAVLMLTVLARASQTPHNPSPMVDFTRAHRRIPKTEVAGARRTLSLGLGMLLLPQSHRRKIPLLILSIERRGLPNSAREAARLMPQY
jgi:hypothetical protein